MSKLYFKLRDYLSNFTSMKCVNMVSKHILSLLSEYSEIIIDFDELTVTPSLADQLIGVIAEKLGKFEFNNRIHIRNINCTDKILLNHVINRRLIQSKLI